MAPQSRNKHLSEISTRWEEIRAACDPGVKNDALTVLLNRYHPAVYRYLLAALRNEEAAEELFQEFALRFLRSVLHRASPERGRFRHYLKGVLYNLIADYKRRRPTHQPLPADVAAPSASADADQLFLESWRDEMLARAWTALQEDDRETGRPLYTVLHLRTENPALPGPRLAEAFAARLGRPVTSNATRQMLYYARRRFADLLLEEVQRSLVRPQPGQLEQELCDLGLLEYCRPALERRGSEQEPAEVRPDNASGGVDHGR